MPWNEDGTEYTPPGGWNPINKKKKQAEALKRPTRPTMYDVPLSAEARKKPTRPTMYEAPATPPANAEVFSNALKQQWKTQAPSTTASPFDSNVSKADQLSQALQRLSSKPIDDTSGTSTKYTPATPKPFDYTTLKPKNVPFDITNPQSAAKSQADVADPVKQGPQLEAYDSSNTSTPKPSLWKKTKSVLASVFAPLSDPAKELRSDIAETGASKKLIEGLDAVANSAPIDYLNKQNEKLMGAIGHGVENALQGIGKVSSDVGDAIAPYKSLAKMIPGASTLNTMLTAGQAIGGFTQTDLQNKTLPQEFGAGFRRGVSGLRTNVGEIAKWQGLEQFGNDQMALADVNKTGFDATPGHEFKGWESFLDPHFLASGVGETLPSTLALMPLGFVGGALGTTAATATKMGAFATRVMQAAGAGALSAPMEAAMEAGQVYEEMRKNGATVEEAKHAGDKVWLHNTALLAATNSFEFGSFFLPKGVNKVLGSLPSKIASGAVMEGAEEGAQTWISNAAQGKPTSLSDPDMQQSIGLGALMGMGFGLAGGSDHEPTVEKAQQAIQNIRDQVISMLSDEDRNDLDIHIKDALAQGMTEDEAFNHALDMIADNPDGAKIVEQATQQEIENERVRLEALQPATGPADYSIGAKLIIKGFGNTEFTVVDSYNKKVRIKNANGDIELINKSLVVGSPITTDIAETPQQEAEAQAVPEQATDEQVTEDEQMDEAALVEAPERPVEVAPTPDVVAPQVTAPSAPETVSPASEAPTGFHTGAKVTNVAGRVFTVNGYDAEHQIVMVTNQDGKTFGNPIKNLKPYVEPQSETPATPEVKTGAVNPEIYQKAKDHVISTGKATVSDLQKNFKLNHTDAMNVMDELETNGVVSPYNGAKPREVLHKPTAAPTTLEPTEVAEKAPKIQEDADKKITTVAKNSHPVTSHITLHNGKVTVVAKTKNLDHELLPENFDASSLKDLSYSFDLNDYKKLDTAGNPHYARSQFIKKQINYDAINEKHWHNALIDRILDAQRFAIDEAINPTPQFASTFTPTHTLNGQPIEALDMGNHIKWRGEGNRTGSDPKAKFKGVPIDNKQVEEVKAETTPEVTKPTEIKSPVTKVDQTQATVLEEIKTEVPNIIDQPKKSDESAKTNAPAPTNVLNDHLARMELRAEAARQRLKTKYGSGGTTLSSGMPPDVITDLSIIGYTKLLKGVVGMTEWTKVMMDEASGIFSNSERIRKWLPTIYTMSKQIADADDPDTLIDELLTDAFGEDFKENIVAPTAPTAEAKTSAQLIANDIKELIRQGADIKSTDLFRIADKVYNGTQSEGTYTPKDAYDAMELAVNQYLLEQTDMDFTSRDPLVVKDNVEKLVALVSKLPTQSKRTEGQEQFQQFSTPPAIAYVASWIANITNNDVVLEPSAGIGGLALFGKADGADVIVNELDPRRLDIIKQMPFDQFFMEDGEQINNIMPKAIKPTVVLMNPPFSTSATRGVTDTKNSFNHVDQALKRLETNGRLVAILGLGREGNSKSFNEWIEKLRTQGHTVRAIVGIDGKNYAKYGTSFGVQFVVIDKLTDQDSQRTVTRVSTLNEVIDLLGGIADARQPAIERDRTSEQNANQSTSAKNPNRNSGTGRNGSNSGSRNPSRTTTGVGNTDSETTNPVDQPRSNDGTTDDVRNPVDTTNDDGRTDDVRGAADTSGEDSTGNTTGDSTEDTGSVGQQEDGSRDSSDKERPVKELTDAIFEDYEPTKLNIKGAKKHLGRLAESAAMAAIELPDLKYKIKLPDYVITEGRLSSAQLEVVAYAGQAHMQILRDGRTRKGIFVGDGTGFGKGREMVGIILDNFAQGRTKAVWVSENNGLIPSANRDWTALDGSKEDLFEVPNLGAPIKQKRGVLFTTYNTLASGSSDTSGNAKQSRLDQLIEWLGRDFDGVIIFDEAHNMSNVVATAGPRGTKDPAQRALAGVALQDALPNARIVYASATGATEVSNLAYAGRLGMWGTGTAFSNVLDFINKITAGGIAAMELVARDMKAMGLYIARNLSYNGVEYQKITHNLTADQTETYDTLAGAWQIVLQNMNAALEAIGVTKDGKTLDGKAKGKAAARFWSANQSFFNQVLTAMQMPSVLAEAEKDLADGKSIVMQLVNTNAASAKRQITKIEQEQGSLEDLDLTPKDILLTYVNAAFPIQQFEEYVDDKGVVRSRPVKDSNGNPVINMEAQAMKDDLLAKLSSIRVPLGPLEMVINHFGTDMVAEVTGRKQRVVYRKNPDTGRMEPKLEKRSDKNGEADTTDFQAGKKRILIFSDAGGTGRSYHADRAAKNQQQRMHYLVQAGWQATKAVQGFGRSHRTNQASAPVYKLFTTNLKGQMRFISSIARRLDQLGALTKGQRQTGSQGLFSASDNLEGNVAKRALVQFYLQMVSGTFLPGLNAREVFTKMGIADSILSPTGQLNQESEDIYNVPRFLNRILCLESGLQNQVFEAFQSVMEVMTEIALQDGTLDSGMENIKADTTKIIEETEIRRDEETNSVTKYVELELGHKTIATDFKKLLADPDLVGVYRNDKSKKVRVVVVRGTRTLSNGSVVDNYLLQGPERFEYKYMTENVFRNTKWKKLNFRSDIKEEFDDLVNALQAGGLSKSDATAKAIDELLPAEDMLDAAIKSLPEYRTQTLHMISGTLLPVWDRLPTDSVRVVRAMTDDGKLILGRIITENVLDVTLHRLGADKRSKDIDKTTLADKILDDNATIILVNGWKLSKRRISNQWRIEITGPNLYRNSAELRQLGAFTETIAYETRYFMPTGDNANSLIENMVNLRPIQEINYPGGSNAQTASQRDDEDYDSLAAPATSGSATQKPKKPRKKREAHPVTRLINETKQILTPKATEKIAELIATTLETTIYKGHVRRGAQGTYDSKHYVTNVTDEAYGEWRVVGHELGHALSDFYTLRDDKLSSQYDKTEMLDMAYSLYTDPSKLKNLSKKAQVEEGFAEFFRQWVADPVVAEKNAPNTFEAFTDFIENNDRLVDVFAKVRTMVDADLKGTVLERVTNGIVSNGATDDRVLGRQKILNKAERLTFNTVDSTLPAKKIMDALKEMGIKVKVDLAKLLALSGNAMSKAKHSFTSIATDHLGKRFKDIRALQTIEQEAIDTIGEAIGWDVIKLKTLDVNYPLYKKFKTMGAKDIFDAILLALRVQERYSEGHTKLPMTLEMANEILEIAEKRFPSVWDSKQKKGSRGLAEEFSHTFSYIVLEKLQRAGLITAETRKRIEAKSHFYIPLLEDKKEAVRINASEGSGRTSNTTVRHFKGKVAPVLNPTQAVLIKLVEVEQAIEHKRVADALHTALEQEGMGQFGRVSLTPPKKAITLSAEQILQKMDKNVLELLDDEDVLEEVFQDKSLTFFQPAGLEAIDPKQPIIMNMRNGVPVYIELHPDVYKMFLSMQPVMLNTAMKIAAHFSRATRHIALAATGYFPNAVVRDAATTVIQSKAPIATMTKGLLQSIGTLTGKSKQADAIYDSYVNSGAFNSAAENMITGQLKRINEDALIRTNAPGWFKAKSKTNKNMLVRVLSSPITAPHRILKFTEELPRIAEYVSVMKKGFADVINEGTTDANGKVTPLQDKNGKKLIASEMWDLYLEKGTDALPKEIQDEIERVLIDAAYAGSEVTTNFNLHGASDFVRSYVPTVAFLHGTMQGLYRTGRQWNDRKGKTTALTLGAMGAVALAAWFLMNGDDDDKKFLQDMDSMARDKYLWLPSSIFGGAKGIYIALAKPFEFAIPMNLLERYLDHMDGDPNARSGVLADLKSLFSGITGINVVSSLYTTVNNMHDNERATGGQIVPMGEEGKAPYMQKDESISLTSRSVAKLVADIWGDSTKGFSPRMTDYFIKQNFGKFGGGLLTIADMAIKLGQTKDIKQAYQASKPIAGLEYVPFVGQFIRSSAEGNSRIVEDFYHEYNQLLNYSKTAAANIKTIKEDAKKNPNLAKLNLLPLPSVPRNLLKSENILKLSYLPAMKYLADEMSISRKAYVQAIGEAPNAEKRRMLVLQKDYVEKLTAGLLFHFTPATPHPDSGITQAKIDELTSYYLANAQKKLNAEAETKDGVTDQVIYLTNMSNMVK